MTSVSIIVPVRNEATIIAPALRRLRVDFPDCELIVVDGGSTDATVGLATPLAHVVEAPPGRARQMNAGAGHAHGEVLWFIHADTRVDPAALHQLRAAVSDPAVAGGGCAIRFDRDTPMLRWLARSSTWRARRLHQVFGDQAMFVRRSIFQRLGGFPDLPLMEDLEMSRRLHRAGRLVVLPGTCVASARRFDTHGVIRMILFMQYLKLLYFAGIDPARIARCYAAGPRTWRGWVGKESRRRRVPDP
jgi:rSAM/selenodomain-associated transferase 2